MFLVIGKVFQIQWEPAFKNQWLKTKMLKFYNDFLIRWPPADSNITWKVMTDDMQTSQYKYLLVPAVWPVFVYMSGILGLYSEHTVNIYAFFLHWFCEFPNHLYRYMYLKTYPKFTFCIKSQEHVSDEKFLYHCIQIFYSKCTSQPTRILSLSLKVVMTGCNQINKWTQKQSVCRPR